MIDQLRQLIVKLNESEGDKLLYHKYLLWRMYIKYL